MKIEPVDFRYDEGLRDRVDKEVSMTITTKSGGVSQFPMIKESDETVEPCDARMDEGIRSRQDLDVSCTITSHMKNQNNDYTAMIKENREENIRIRRLTPKEAWRLMGFKDEDFDKASKVVSDCQLYKQAGNSIVVDVLMAIFKEML